MIKLSDFSRFKKSIKNFIEKGPRLQNALNDKKISSVSIGFISEHGNAMITHKLQVLPNSGYYSFLEMIPIAHKYILKREIDNLMTSKKAIGKKFSQKMKTYLQLD